MVIIIGGHMKEKGIASSETIPFDLLLNRHYFTVFVSVMLSTMIELVIPILFGSTEKSVTLERSSLPSTTAEGF